MKVSRIVFGFVIAVALFMPALSAAAQTTSDQDKLSATLITDLDQKPAAEKIAIYDAAAHSYLEVLKKFNHADVAKQLEPYLLFEAANDGNPQGYRDYQAEIVKIFKDKTQDGVQAFGVVNFISKHHLAELVQTPR